MAAAAVAAWVGAVGARRRRRDRNGRTELWHTRLAAAGPDGGADEHNDDDRTVRAIWATDPDFGAWLDGTKTPPSQAGTDSLPFRMPLRPKDRLEIVRATSDFGISGYTPDPLDVERLLLTSLGAWLDLRGAWNPPPDILSIAEWRQRSTLGRDQHVRVVQRGYLLPFGHPAAVVTVSERRREPTPTGAQAGYLRQQLVLVVRGPTKRYAAFAQRANGRRLPFRRLMITTTTMTPALDPRVAFTTKYGTDAFVTACRTSSTWWGRTASGAGAASPRRSCSWSRRSPSTGPRWRTCGPRTTIPT